MSKNSKLEFAANVGQYPEKYSVRWIEDKIAEQETREHNGKAVQIPKELIVTENELKNYYAQYDLIIAKLKEQSKYIK
jgi:hypothetical protein